MSGLRLVWMVLTFAGFLPAVSHAAPPEISTPRSFLEWTIAASGGVGIVVGLVPQEIGGKIAVCGAVWPLNGKREGLAMKSRILREAIIELRGNVVKTNMSAFAVFDTKDAAKTFRCSVSTLPWQGPYKGDEFKVRMRSSTIRD